MTEASTAAADTEQRELTITRVLQAPRELVWKAWTEPAHIAQFFAPAGMHIPLDSVTMDVRPGGAFEVTMVMDHDGTEHFTAMTYREVVEPERLVFGWGEVGEPGSALSALTLADLGDGTTEITFRWSGFVGEEMFGLAEAGCTSMLGNLARHLATLRA